MDIRRLVTKLCAETRNPFLLAQHLGIIVLFEPLGSVRGYYSKTFRQRFIHINHSLNDVEQTFVCAHELGHALLHPNINTPFLKASTLFSVDRLEVQANRFAVDLLYSDEELQPFLERSVSEAAAYMGVPHLLAEYRMDSVVHTLHG